MEYRPPRCEVIPLPNAQTSFRVDGVERTRWHFGRMYPRPFFFPLVGPSGTSLTRVGHPGAPDHDHHRSVWFGHADVGGVNFWSDETPARIRQKRWLCYQDGDDGAAMAVVLGWLADEEAQKELVEQQLIAIVRPGGEGETFLELQSTFRPRTERLVLGTTNFGLLAVRVAKGLSRHFGAGKITNSNGEKDEEGVFGKQAAWVDYSGLVAQRTADGCAEAVEGITYFDHPSNPTCPTHWHVRDDGWMGASVCMHSPITITDERPLVLRYLLHAHRGGVSFGTAERVAKDFAASSPCRAVPSTRKHRQWEIRRA